MEEEESIIKPHATSDDDIYIVQPEPSKRKIEKVELRKTDEATLGFHIRGGGDQPIVVGNTGIFITKIREGGIASKSGKLSPGDRILEINGIDVRNVARNKALSLIKKSDLVKLLVEKRVIEVVHVPETDIPREGDPDVVLVELVREKSGKGLGLGFNIRGGLDHPHVPDDPGIFVTRIRDDGAAALDGRLCPGDKIIEINNINVLSVPRDRAIDLLQLSKYSVSLLVQKKGLDKTMEKYEPETTGPEEFVILRNNPRGVGINMRGGTGTPYLPRCPGIMVSSIRQFSVADKSQRVKVGDRILEINGVDVREVKQEYAHDVFNKAPYGEMTFLVERDAEAFWKKHKYPNWVSEILD